MGWAAFMLVVGLFWLLIPMTAAGRALVVRLGPGNQWWIDHPMYFLIVRLVTCVPLIAAGAYLLASGG